MNVASFMRTQPAALAGVLDFLVRHLSERHGHTPDNTLLPDAMVTFALILTFPAITLALRKMLPRKPVNMTVMFFFEFFMAALVIDLTIVHMWLPIERQMVTLTNHISKWLIIESSDCHHFACRALYGISCIINDTAFWDLLSIPVASIPLLISFHATGFKSLNALRVLNENLKKLGSLLPFKLVTISKRVTFPPDTVYN